MLTGLHGNAIKKSFAVLPQLCSLVAWLPAQLIPAHKKKTGSGVAGLRKNDIEQELFGPIKLSGRALYDDGQMINSNLINNVTKERLG